MENTQENKHNSFILFSDYLDELLLLPMEQRGLLITTVFSYVNDKPLPELDLATALLWQTWKKCIDRNAEKWKETRQRRSEAGRKGGLAAHHRKAEASNAEQDLPGQAVSVPVNVPVPVSVPVNVPVTVPDTATEAIPPYSIAFPLKNGSKYVVTGDEFENYVHSYPMLDVPQVFQNVLGWLEANPSRQKTAEMMPRFLTNWLEGDAKKAMRKETYPNEGNPEKTDFSSLDHFGTVL